MDKLNYCAVNSNRVVFLDMIIEEKLVVDWAGGDPEFEIGNEVIFIGGAHHKVVGSGVAQRDVYHFITSKHRKLLRAGLTVHRSLASSTPHTFELSPELGFEELFWFHISDGGKALIEGEGLWPDGTRVDAAWPVRDGDVVQVPMGSHRVVALPDVDGRFPQVSYVWVYLCKKQEWEK